MFKQGVTGMSSLCILFGVRLVARPNVAKIQKKASRTRTLVPSEHFVGGILGGGSAR